MSATDSIKDVTLRAIRRGANSRSPVEFWAKDGVIFVLDYWRGTDLPYIARRVGAQTSRRFSRLCDLRAHLENPG